MIHGNLFAGLPQSSPDELVDVLAAAGPVRVERIVSTGQSSPPEGWYDQDEWEFVVLLSGSASIEFEGEQPQDLHPGDWLAIPPHARHRVTRTATNEPTVWLAVFAPAQRLATE